MKVKVLGPYTFSIGDTTSYGSYHSGGIFRQIKPPKTLKFVSIIKFSVHKPFLHIFFFFTYKFGSKTDRKVLHYRNLSAHLLATPIMSCRILQNSTGLLSFMSAFRRCMSSVRNIVDGHGRGMRYSFGPVDDFYSSSTIHIP